MVHWRYWLLPCLIKSITKHLLEVLKVHCHTDQWHKSTKPENIVKLHKTRTGNHRESLSNCTDFRRMHGTSFDPLYSPLLRTVNRLLSCHSWAIVFKAQVMVLNAAKVQTDWVFMWQVIWPLQNRSFHARLTCSFQDTRTCMYHAVLSSLFIYITSYKLK